VHLGGGEGIRKGDDDKVPDTLTDCQEAEARYLSSSGGLALRNKKPAAGGRKTKTNRNNLGVILMALRSGLVLAQLLQMPSTSGKG